MQQTQINPFNLTLSFEQYNHVEQLKIKLMEEPFCSRNTNHSTFTLRQISETKTIKEKKDCATWITEVKALHSWQTCLIDSQFTDSRIVLKDIFGNTIFCQSEWVDILYKTSSAGSTGVGSLQYSHDQLNRIADNLFDIATKELIAKSLLNCEYNKDISDQNLIHKVAAAITSDEKETYRATIILKLMIWLQKRKIRKMCCKGMETALYLFSTTNGVGKSAFISYLVKPFSFLSANTKVDELLDSSNQLGFTTKSVIKMDEFAKYNDNEHLAALKRLITASSITTRKKYTDNVQEKPVYFCFYISSNHDVADVIHDSTGNRRFTQIHCRESAFDFDVYNNINIFDLYKSVDEFSDPLTSEEIKEIRAFKEEQRHISIEESFLEESFPKTDETTEEVFLTTNQLLTKYNEWCVNSKHKHSTTRKFLKTIRPYIDSGKYAISEKRMNFSKGFAVFFHKEDGGTL